jgi:acyl carrier protein
MQDFINFAAEVMDVDSSELSENTARDEFVKWDSLMHLRLVMEIEEKYGVEIPIDEVPNIVTLSDFYQYIK